MLEVVGIKAVTTHGRRCLRLRAGSTVHRLLRRRRTRTCVKLQAILLRRGLAAAKHHSGIVHALRCGR